MYTGRLIPIGRPDDLDVQKMSMCIELDSCSTSKAYNNIVHRYDMSYSMTHTYINTTYMSYTLTHRI